MKYELKDYNTLKCFDEFECPACGKPLDIDGLLNKYGPAGLYELAEILKKAADEDISDSYFEPYT
jgi:hypothetical protein